MKIPDFVEIVNVTDKPRRIADPGLWERGGAITLGPGETATVPLAVFHRICMNPFVMRKERWEKLQAETAAVAAAAEPAEEAEAEQPQRRPRGRPRKEKNEDA